MERQKIGIFTGKITQNGWKITDFSKYNSDFNLNSFNQSADGTCMFLARGGEGGGGGGGGGEGEDDY